MGSEAYRLCYVEHGWAWFTTQDVTKQWGDDWDDAPYEHNAGEPYEPRDGESWDLMVVAYLGSFETPADFGGHNSSWSVQDINRGLVPWLTTWDRDNHIHAGATVTEFCDWVKSNGGRVFLEATDD